MMPPFTRQFTCKARQSTCKVRQAARARCPRRHGQWRAGPAPCAVRRAAGSTTDGRRSPSRTARGRPGIRRCGRNRCPEPDTPRRCKANASELRAASRLNPDPVEFAPPSYRREVPRLRHFRNPSRKRYRPASPFLGMPARAGAPTIDDSAPGSGCNENKRTGLPFRVDCMRSSARLNDTAVACGRRTAWAVHRWHRDTMALTTEGLMSYFGEWQSICWQETTWNESFLTSREWWLSWTAMRSLTTYRCRARRASGIRATGAGASRNCCRRPTCRVTSGSSAKPCSRRSTNWNRGSRR